MRLLALSLLSFAFGCDAIFTDLSPSDTTFFDAAAASDVTANDATTNDAAANDVANVTPGDDAGATVDAADAGGDSDAGVDDAGVDAGSPVLLSSGSFEDRGGYSAAGSVRLEQLSPGEYQVVMSDDFSSAAVPGPVVVVTPRDAIGTMLTSEDIQVTTLEPSMIAGPGTYTFSAPSVPVDGFVFIYCEPFGIETARAQLVTP